MIGLGEPCKISRPGTFRKMPFASYETAKSFMAEQGGEWEVERGKSVFLLEYPLPERKCGIVRRLHGVVYYNLEPGTLQRGQIIRPPRKTGNQWR